MNFFQSISTLTAAIFSLLFTIINFYQNNKNHFPLTYKKRKNLNYLLNKYNVLNSDKDIFNFIYEMDNAERKYFFESKNDNKINIASIISIFVALSSLLLNHTNGISSFELFPILIFAVLIVLIIINLSFYKHYLTKKRKINIAFYRYCYLDTFNLKERKQYFYEKS